MSATIAQTGQENHLAHALPGVPWMEVYAQ